MSDKGEKTCPLCAEEMDLTDQQLKPCKCGYQICVWCWNHIMELAEKDDTEGCCPACRAPYDKEKIVGMAANCERLVAEINSDRKQKSQKTKPKASEGRKHLNDVRVIQRNLVYIIGLPLNLADEDILQRREYFSQYGKVLKVSISRTATGVIQNSSNNSCCVYITYSKEEEAVRCIQSVHHFVLDGKSLRACFGTTKYCHAWLRNLPCNNPDCLYLHDFGSQDDSFSKDEIVSAFTRSRVQQIIGATNNLHRRSGNVLPPSEDEYSNLNVPLTSKPVVNSPSNNIVNQVRGSLSDNGTGSSNALSGESSWVTRVSARLPPVTSSAGLHGLPGQKPELSNSPQVFASEAMNIKSSDLDIRTIPEESCKVCPNAKLEPLDLAKKYINRDLEKDGSSTDAGVLLVAAPATIRSSDHLPCLPSSNDIVENIAAPARYLEFTECSSTPDSHKDGNFFTDWEGNRVCSGLSSLRINSDLEDDLFRPAVLNSSISNYSFTKIPGNQGSYVDINRHSSEFATSLSSTESTTSQSLLNSDDLQVKEPNIHLPCISCSSSSPHNLKRSSCSWQLDSVSTQSNHCQATYRAETKKEGVTFPLPSGNVVLSNGFSDKRAYADLDGNPKFSTLFSDVRRREYIGNCGSVVDSNVASDMGESTIISNILSMDMDTWENPLTSPHSFIKLLSEGDKEHGSLKSPSLRKVQNSNQSRFSFARQDDCLNQATALDQSFSNAQHVQDNFSASHEYWQNKDPCMVKHSTFSPGSFVGYDNIPTSNCLSSCNLSVSKTPSSTPPGFSVLNRAPPPGFSSHGKVDQAVAISAHNLLQMPAQPNGNVGNTRDVEFMDPAILEVGKGVLAPGLNNTGFDMLQRFSAQCSPFEHESRRQMLFRQSNSAHQSFRLPNHFGNRSAPQNDIHGVPPILPDQFQANDQFAFSQMNAQQLRNGHLSNGQWGRLNDARSVSDLDFSQVLTDERLGFNKVTPNYDDLKFRMSSSSNLYTRGFGM